MAAVFQFACHGAPPGYCGDEIGIGAHGEGQRRYPMMWSEGGQSSAVSESQV